MMKKVKKGQYLDILLRSKKTVFSTKDIALLWGEISETATRVRLSYYVKTGGLYRIHRGLYAKDKNYDRRELATKIFTPSYVSFETVLAQAGVVFQFYSQIFTASYLTRESVIDGQTYTFRKIKDSILTNQTGIEARETYFIASPERAFLDVVYLNKEYYFDNPHNLNWKKVDEILPIYGGNRRMEAKVKKYRALVEQERS